MMFKWSNMGAEEFRNARWQRPQPLNQSFNLQQLQVRCQLSVVDGSASRAAS